MIGNSDSSSLIACAARTCKRSDRVRWTFMLESEVFIAKCME